MIIKKEALKMLAVLNTSCRVLGKKKIDNTLYIHKCATFGKDMKVCDFIANFPNGTMAYKLLEPFAKRMGAEEIDDKLIVQFFGGKEHLNFVLEQLSDWEKLRGKNKPLSQEFRDGFLFAHMLVPVEIVKKIPVISGKYQVAGLKIRVRGLVAHPLIFPDFYRDLEVGKEYLTHYATVIGPASDKSVKWIMGEHIKSDKFLSAIERLKVIDYRKFWSLKGWTEELLEQCGF